ncbi:MAG: hypothetical protein WBH01_03850 [Dehalococcoidia bacterium]
MSRAIELAIEEERDNYVGMLSSIMLDASSRRPFEYSSVGVLWQTLFPEAYERDLSNYWQGCTVHQRQRHEWCDYVLKEKNDLVVVEMDDIIDTEYANLSSRNYVEKALYYFLGPVEEKEEELELEVVKRFKELDEVELIYADIYMESERFKIFTSNTRYDDDLMDKLLGIEFELRSIYRDSFPRFEYIPRIYDSIDEIVRRGSKLIYKRGYYVILGGSSLAGRKERETSEAVA